MRKGIILAGGSGTRLYPITLALSKQLAPVYDKPMIYYSLSVLMLSGIREIAIITTPHDVEQYERLLGTGEQWGLEFHYLEQPEPDGIAQAYLIAENFLAGSPSTLILGDNIFYGNGLVEILKEAHENINGASVFGYRVHDPERYGVVDFHDDGRVKQIIEKPAIPPSSYAITGLYYLDGTAPERTKIIKPSDRGELEITSLLNQYCDEDATRLHSMGRGFAWFDTGTQSSLLQASVFVQTLQDRQQTQVGSPDEIAFNQGWISEYELQQRIKLFEKSNYGQYLMTLL